jgi:signal transduction histidine kinase
MKSMLTRFGRWQAGSGTLARIFMISLLAIIPMAGLLAEMYAHYLADKELSARREIDQAIDSFMREQVALLDSKRAVLLALAQTDEIVRNDPVECPTMLQRVEQNFPSLLTAIRIDDPTQIICTAKGVVATNFTRAQAGFERQAYRRGEHDTYLLLESRFAEKPVIVINQPLVRAGEQPRGVLAAAIGFEWIAERKAESAMLTPLRIAVLDPRGRVFEAVGFEGGLSVGETLSPDMPLMRLLQQAGDTMPAQRVSLLMGERFVALRTIDLAAGQKLHFIIAAPVDQVMPSIAREVLSAMAVMALVLLLSGAAAMGLAHQLIGKPVRQMIGLCQRLIDGDLSARTNLPHGATDMGEMAAWLDRTAEALEQRQIALEQREKALENAVLRAEMANRRKSDFLAHMSHELRTPLNAVLGYAEVIRRGMFGSLPDRYRDYAQNIHQAGQHLLDLINDILDLAAIEASKRELREEPLSIAEELQAAFAIVQPQAKPKHLQLSLEIAEGTLTADRRMVKQILLNLLSNAIKYTPHAGRITLAAAIEEGGVALKVADNGIGIAPEQIETALSPYGRVGSAYTRTQASGIGLGLPLAKALAELHGGSLSLESQQGVGTTVTVWFPAARFRPAPPDTAAAPAA